MRMNQQDLHRTVSIHGLIVQISCSNGLTPVQNKHQSGLE